MFSNGFNLNFLMSNSPSTQQSKTTNNMDVTTYSFFKKLFPCNSSYQTKFFCIPSIPTPSTLHYLPTIKEKPIQTYQTARKSCRYKPEFANQKRTQGGFEPISLNYTDYFASLKNLHASELSINILINNQIQTLPLGQFFELTKIYYLSLPLFAELSFLTKCLKYYQKNYQSNSNIKVTSESEQLTQIYLKHTSHKIGWGVYALKSISKGTLIGQYTGVVIPSSEGGRYAMEYKTPFYKDACIDAEFMGNLTRFINHSSNPNCIISPCQIHGYTELHIIATENIQVGHQILIDYGPSYWQYKKPEMISNSIRPETSMKIVTKAALL